MMGFQQYLFAPNSKLINTLIIISIIAIVRYLIIQDRKDEFPILAIIAKNNLNWVSSTTVAPISTPSVIAKYMISNIYEKWPEEYKSIIGREVIGIEDNDWQHTIPISAARRIVEEKVLAEIKRLCEKTKEGTKCNPNEVEPEFGMTPLHYASLFGDDSVMEYLLELGADPNIEDFAGRKPLNMTFQNFSANSKAASILRGSTCQIPEIFMEKSNPENSLREFKRLVSEGEPVILRNVLDYLVEKRGEFQFKDATHFVNIFEKREVDVAGVPYAEKFKVGTIKMSLKRFFDEFMDSSAHKENRPVYVFQQDDVACEEGYQFLKEFVLIGMPSSPTEKFPLSPLICPPIQGNKNIMHFYLGNQGTGAPFHIHSDALNLMISGLKRWWLMPPRPATFSRMHINKWMNEYYKEGKNHMECTQNPGDLMYVPFDWGHAAINQEDSTFGYTMELTNRRDTFMSVMGAQCQ